LPAARLAAPRGIPILPVNMGSLGLPYQLHSGRAATRPLTTHAGGPFFSLSERVMISVELERTGKVIDTQRVLNEV